MIEMNKNELEFFENEVDVVVEDMSYKDNKDKEKKKKERTPLDEMVAEATRLMEEYNNG